MANSFVPLCNLTYSRAIVKEICDKPALRKGLYFSVLHPELLSLLYRCASLEDGIYFLLFDGRGLPIKLSDGGKGNLGSFISGNIGHGQELVSLSNDNCLLRLNIRQLGPLPTQVQDEQTALVLENSVFHLQRPTLDRDRMGDTSCQVGSRADSDMLQRRYKIMPKLRTHPGHQFAIEWTPDQAVYSVNPRSVKVTMRLRNSGHGAVRFTQGTYFTTLPRLLNGLHRGL